MVTRQYSGDKGRYLPPAARAGKKPQYFNNFYEQRIFPTSLFPKNVYDYLQTGRRAYFNDDRFY